MWLKHWTKTPGLFVKVVVGECLNKMRNYCDWQDKKTLTLLLSTTEIPSVKMVNIIVIIIVLAP